MQYRFKSTFDMSSQTVALYRRFTIREVPVEIQTPTHWSKIGRSVRALPHVLSPSSILPPLSSHCSRFSDIVSVFPPLSLNRVSLYCASWGVSLCNIDNNEAMPITVLVATNYR
jgi:hypothetical protein